MSTTPEPPEVTVAREALLAAQNQGHRFRILAATEIRTDAMLAAAPGTGSMGERSRAYPMDEKRTLSRAMVWARQETVNSETGRDR